MGDDGRLSGLGQHEACADHALHRGGAQDAAVPCLHTAGLQGARTEMPVLHPAERPSFAEVVTAIKAMQTSS